MSDNEDRHRERERRLSEAYQRMLDRVRDQYPSQPAESDESGLSRALAWARERAVDMGELSREEAGIVAEFLWRDMVDAGGYLADTGRDFRDWLAFDLELLEAGFLKMLLSVADKTRLEWLRMGPGRERLTTYRTGEMTAAGTLVCEACEEPMRFRVPGHIPPCPKCAATAFRRYAL